MRSDVIVSDPSVMVGKSVLPGTCIAVEFILEKLASGESKEQIVAEYSRLSEESIRVAPSFASKALRACDLLPHLLVSEVGLKGARAPIRPARSEE